MLLLRLIPLIQVSIPLATYFDQEDMGCPFHHSISKFVPFLIFSACEKDQIKTGFRLRGYGLDTEEQTYQKVAKISRTILFELLESSDAVPHF